MDTAAKSRMCFGLFFLLHSQRENSMATCLMANRFSMQINAFDDFQLAKKKIQQYTQPWSGATCVRGDFIEKKKKLQRDTNVCWESEKWNPKIRSCKFTIRKHYGYGCQNPFAGELTANIWQEKRSKKKNAQLRTRGHVGRGLGRWSFRAKVKPNRICVDTRNTNSNNNGARSDSFWDKHTTESILLFL